MMNFRNGSCAIVALSLLAGGCAMSEPHTAPATPSTLTLQELEPGTCVQVLFERSAAGSTGAGVLNPPNTRSARVEWAVRSPSGGRYAFVVRFANGSNAARPGTLHVGGSGETAVFPFPQTGGWAQWQETRVELDLAPGENRLVLRADGDTGLGNIDSLTVIGANPTPGNCGKSEASADERGPVDLSAPPVGWATMGEGVTGGGPATPQLVRSMTELQALAAGDEPRVLHVDGGFSGTLHVGSNKTIIGRPGARIEGQPAALRLTGSRNVIIRNLTLVGDSAHHEPNTVLHDAENIWLDHNSFVDGRPDLVVLSGTTDLVTISWNHFRYTVHAHEHGGVNIGASDADVQGRGRLRTTLHHNFFAELVNERMPRVRFGQVHVFNNLADAGTDELIRSYYAVRPGVDANVRSERNIYRNFVGPSWWWSSERLGNPTSTVFNYARGNAASILQSIGDTCVPDCVKGPVAIKEHEGVTGVAGFYGNGTAFTPPYTYNTRPQEGLEASIRAGAGAR